MAARAGPLTKTPSWTSLDANHEDDRKTDSRRPCDFSPLPIGVLHDTLEQEAVDDNEALRGGGKVRVHRGG